MSHFSVGVICSGPESVEEALIPFCEGAEEYYERMPDTEISDYIFYYRQDHPEINIPDDELWEHIKTERGISDEDVDDEYIYSFYNPNAKWDWYQIGGRWKKSLKVKKKSEHYIEESTISEPFREKVDLRKERGKYRWVDAAPIKEILWDQMNTPSSEDKKERSRFWDLYVEGKGGDEGKRQYNCFYKPDYYLQKYKNKGEYLRQSALFLTHDLYIEPEGRWLSQGDMGWFGLDNSTLESTVNYERQFYNIIKDPKYKDLWLVIVDCHI